MYKIICIAKILIIFLILTIMIMWENTEKTPKPDLSKSLYHRLGGIYAIAGVIDHFSDRVVENPVVGKDSQNPRLREWHKNQLTRLPGLKFMRTLWICDAMGGPYKYVPTVPGKCPMSLENAHKKFGMNSEEFGAVAEELAKTLDHFSIPLKEKNEVLAIFAAHESEIDGNNIGSEEGTCPFS